MTSAIVRGPLDAVPHTGPHARGLSEARYVGPDDGAVHLEATLASLGPGGRITGHLHPFEEAFFILSGRGYVAIADTRYAVREGDYGFAPIAHPHAWNNPFDEPLRWLRIRSPQPRRIGTAHGSYGHAQLPVPDAGEDIVAESPRQRFAGHFEESQLPPPGPLAMPGYHGYNIRDVSIRMMVDELLGARHLTLFVVEFQPREEGAFSAKEHFHPFEEIYYFTQGGARGRIEGRDCEVGTGDMVFAGTGASHGFTNPGSVPVRWIEAQTPAPPADHALFFENEWDDPGW